MNLIDTQFDLAILVALEESGEPTSKERIIHKTKTFWLRWKKHSQKQEITRIRQRLSDLTTKRIVLQKNNNGKASYYLNPAYEPNTIIKEYLSELFNHASISFWGNKILFDNNEINDHSLIFTLQEIRGIILKYGISE
ncbi:hypothetical protein [Rummeliibacillus pycnus]|uniref:hypothetical protein n=1 Tax=Rummeliibacillus pycnus TaxID=101070 RepID=UPI003D268960